MTTFSNIASSEYAVGAPITSAWGSKVSNNLLAVQEGDASAPVIAYATAAGSAGSATNAGSVTGSGVITQSNMAANSVGASQLKNTNQDASVSSGAINVALVSPATTFRGLWGWSVTTANSVSPSFQDNAVASYSAAVSVTLHSTGNGTTNYVRCYYVNSSPPYDLGDGQIPIFMHALVDKTTRDIIAVHAAIDPPWAYNGPTNIIPDMYRNGKIYQYKRQIELDVPDFLSQLLNKNTTVSQRENILDRLHTDKLVEIEITQEMKNADMDIIPHPFIDIPTNAEIVLIDPVSPVLEQLLSMHKVASKDPNADSVLSLFHDGYLKIGNTPLKRNAPKGIMPVSVAWK